ncbi:MAG: class I SAM-dependent methyltransferase [Thermoanaerobaculia bacterium]
MAWYREWFGEEYLELYAYRDAGEAESNLEFAAAHLRPANPRRVLDLACGTGRHTAALGHRGVRAVGVDLSLTLLAKGCALARVRADMRTLPFADATFDWALNFFTSFGYFEAERENFRVLEQIRRVLAPGGELLLDLLNPEQALAHLVGQETIAVDGREVRLERWYDAASRRIHKRIRVADPGRPPRTFLESVRAYSREEVENALAWAGLVPRAVFGDFTGAPFGPTSTRLIVVAGRPR